MPRLPLRRIRPCIVILCALLVTPLVHADDEPGDAPRALDHDAYELWKSIVDPRLSSDGAWVSYALQPGDPEAPSTVEVRAADGTLRHSFARGRDARFSYDATHVICLIAPDKDQVKERRKALKEEKADDIDDRLPKAQLVVAPLGDGDVLTVERVQSFKLPDKAGGLLAFLYERPVPVEDPEPGTGPGPQLEPEPEPEPEPELELEPEPEPDDDDDDAKEKDAGTTLVLRHLVNGAEFRYENVVDYVFSEDGRTLAFTTSVADDAEADDDGVFVVETADGRPNRIASGRGHYTRLTVPKAGGRVAFLTDRATYEDDQPEFVLLHWMTGDAEATQLAASDAPGLRDGWWVSEHGDVSFSELGGRLTFGTAPRPEPEPDDDEGEDDEEDEKVVVDIWNWRDDRLQPQQLIELERDRERTYLAMIDLDSNDRGIVQLADDVVPNVTISAKGDGAVALGTTNVPYRRDASWDWPGFMDAYLIDAATGARQRIIERMQTSSIRLSPQGRFVMWWDGGEQHWFAMNTETRTTANLTEMLPHPVHDERHDRPEIPGNYGIGGWLADDRAVLIHDRNDIWLAHPDGFFPPSCMTDGYGREHDLRLRIVDLDRDRDHHEADEQLLLSVFDRETRASGFAVDVPRSTEPPTILISGDERFGTPRRADEADALLFTRESFDTFPDLWISDATLAPETMTRVSDANPQQAEYLWGSAELVRWRSGSGDSIDGLLYRPDDFDAAATYPMLVYFYERRSDGLHQHHAPAPHRSIINIAFYVSRGYVVFVPDIPYEVGYPGDSAMNAIVPGVLALVEQGFVDPERIGLQGHSWGGYQIAYMVTQTDLFACAEAGAPVSNMTSAYGGIRWGSGLSRMFQYEKTQSRIGGTLWDAQQRYIENSPVFWADRIRTPLLMMHNDEDGAVPWYQGIELFVALRRLDRPCWLVNYNGEPHNLVKYRNRRDWAIRMQQFFDHYLCGAPAPRWLAEGIPAVEKGRTLGLDLLDVGGSPD